MSFVQKLLMPKKLMIAACVMIVTLAIAICVEYVWHFETIKFVKTIAYYLILDYVWASIKREWAGRTR